MTKREIDLEHDPLIQDMLKFHNEAARKAKDNTRGITVSPDPIGDRGPTIIEEMMRSQAMKIALLGPVPREDFSLEAIAKKLTQIQETQASYPPVQNPGQTRNERRVWKKQQAKKRKGQH